MIFRQLFDQVSNTYTYLLAGRGGLNLTHSEALAVFLQRYGAAEPHLRAAIAAFPPDVLRRWCEALGQETFVGSSGRVFPKAMKTSPLLRVWLRRLDAAGVVFKLRHRWTGWDQEGHLLFDTPEGSTTISPGAMTALEIEATAPQPPRPPTSSTVSKRPISSRRRIWVSNFGASDVISFLVSGM